jgi:hypothetical protein
MMIFATHGGSMIPSILPGSALHVRLAGRDILAVGDIVCFPTAEHIVVAHRIIDVLHDGSSPPRYLIRGDAQQKSELLEPTAVALVVERVDGRFVSYRTDGPLGRLEAYLAVHHSRWWRIGGRELWRLACAGSRLRRRAQRWLRRPRGPHLTS